RNQRARLGRYIFLRLKAVMAFSTTFNQVADADVAFRVVVQILAGGLASIEVRVLMRRRAQRQILPIRKERGIGAQVLRDLLGLALLDRGRHSQQVVVVLQRHLNGLV